ncbi:arginase family protein [Nonomuraea insulae]|uniref:arginase family protein n=1 Tax=Nonomuraea insulae TaxID=1616787 RepID=UPI0036D2867B
MVAKVAVVEVPQWRGSGAVTAERLKEGARLLAGLVGGDQRVRVEVDDDLAATAAKVRAAVEGVSGELIVTVGGDCGVELAPVAAARKRYGDRLVVVWFDAHGDLNTPDSSPSGAYHGMVLRALTGEGPAGLVADEPLDAGQIVLAGVRDLDPHEASFVEGHGIRQLPPVVDPRALVEAIEACGGEHRATADDSVVYLHIDFDVLDPRFFESVGCPTPGGLVADELISLVKAVGERFKVVGIGLMEYEPGRAEDQELMSVMVAGIMEGCGRG